MTSPGMKSITPVEKCHSRTHRDCIPSDVAVLFAQNSIQDSAGWGAGNRSTIS